MPPVTRSGAQQAAAPEPYFSADETSEAPGGELESALEIWAEGAQPGEDRLEAMRRLLHCWFEGEEDLDLSGLGLRALPEALGDFTHLYDLNLTFNELASVPDVLYRFDRECMIEIGGNPLASLDVQRFQAISDAQGGPILAFSAGEVWEAFDFHQATALSDALAAWRAELGEAHTAAREWHRGDHAHLEAFGGWLVRLRDTADFAHPVRREMLCERLRDLLAAMDEDPELRASCLHIAHESTGSCDDNVALGLNRFEMALRNREAALGRLSEAELFSLGRGMFRMEQLTRIAEDFTARNPAQDAVEVHLAYQIGLRERLGLPLRVASMRFGNLPQVDAAALDAAARQVLRAEGGFPAAALRRYERVMQSITDSVADASRFRALSAVVAHPLAQWLAEQYTPWQQHVARVRAPAAEAHSARMFDYLERVEARRAAGQMREGQYVSCLNAAKFYANHGLAYAHALRCLAGEAAA